MSRHVFDLTFSVLECPECGYEGAAGVECPNCGRGPQNDPHVERRRGIVARARDLLERDGGEPGTELSFDARLLESLSDWLSALLDLCSRAANEEDVADELCTVVNRLRKWEMDLATTPKYRPYLWYWRLATGVVQQFKAIAGTYCASLATASPSESKVLGNKAQEQIDGATSATDKANRLLDRWQAIERAAEDKEPMAVLIAIAERDVEERVDLNLLNADERANQLYKRVMGAQNCPPGLALGLRLADIQVDPLLDPERFWDCVALTYRRVATAKRNGQAALDQVANSENWIQDLHEVHEELFEIGIELRALAPKFDRPASLARALVRVGHQLFRLDLDWDKSRGGTKHVYFQVQELMKESPDLMLDIVDYLLHAYSQGYDDDQLQNVDGFLYQSGSAWRVGPTEEGRGCLERRVDETVTAAARSVMREGDKVGAHLTLAWNEVYGRDPDAGKGYLEAVKAVEAAAQPIVSPKDSKATLGKMIAAMSDAPQKWVATLTSDKVDGIETVISMVTLLWTCQYDRHGSADDNSPISVTQEEAEAAIHLATTLVQWFRSGVIKPESEQ